MTAPQAEQLLRWAEVDVAALRQNAATVRGLLAERTALLAMVKANGYGHGATLAARAAVAGGAAWLGVYTPGEALALRAEGITHPILVCGWSPPWTHESLVHADVDVTVFDDVAVGAIADAARRVGRTARVHVKIDTGLGRLGVRRDDVRAIADAVRAAGGFVHVAGVFTHFADVDNDEAFTLTQHEAFLQAVEVLRDVAPGALLHTCGSAGILRFPQLHHDLVRMGIALYGYDPRGGPPRVPLRPAMHVFARVAQVKTINVGDSAGYGRTWSARRRSRIATVAMGYGQGVSRALSNRGWVVAGGARSPIVGTVSMDQVTVDVTDAGDVRQGDPVLFVGSDGGISIGADEVADLLGTISYEVLCAVPAAVPRIPVDGADRAGSASPTAVP